MKRRLLGILMTLATCLGAAAAAPPRVATVRVDDVLRKLDATAKANDDYKAKRDAISKDSRKTALDEIMADLELRRSKLAENAGIDPETRKQLLREFMVKQQEARSMQEDFQNFSNEKLQVLNAELVADIRKRLTLIHGTAEKIAQDEGYDWVFDSSGISNTGVPLMLYAKNQNDLTDRVLAVLQPPAAPAPPPAPPPPPVKKPKPQR